MLTGGGGGGGVQGDGRQPGRLKANEHTTGRCRGRGGRDVASPPERESPGQRQREIACVQARLPDQCGQQPDRLSLPGQPSDGVLDRYVGRDTAGVADEELDVRAVGGVVTDLQAGGGGEAV